MRHMQAVMRQSQQHARASTTRLLLQLPPSAALEHHCFRSHPLTHTTQTSLKPQTHTLQLPASPFPPPFPQHTHQIKTPSPLPRPNPYTPGAHVFIHQEHHVPAAPILAEVCLGRHVSRGWVHHLYQTPTASCQLLGCLQVHTRAAQPQRDSAQPLVLVCCCAGWRPLLSLLLGCRLLALGRRLLRCC